MADILGTTANDTILGTGSDDYIYGFAGDDTLLGGAGVDHLFGGQGNDILDAGPGYPAGFNTPPEALYGDVGNDTFRGGGGQDMYGGPGNDVFYVNAVRSAAGDFDYIIPEDRVFEAMGDGTDTVYASVNWTNLAGQDIEFIEVDPSYSGGIYLAGNDNDETVRGNGAANTLIGNGGSDRLYGFAGADTLDGGDGDDYLIGGTGADYMIGGAGSDTFYVDDNQDYLVEAVAPGDDRVATSTSYALPNDADIERFEAITLNATVALDLVGNQFGQTIVGNAGTNIIDGKGGNDELFGGAGADQFRFSSALGAGNVDRILDLQTGTDRIALDHSIFQRFNPGTLDPAFLRIGSLATDDNDFIIYNSDTGALSYDPDGNGAAAAIQFAWLERGLNLTTADFGIY